MGLERKIKFINVLFLTEGRLVPASRFRVLNLIPYLNKYGIKTRIRACIPNKYFFKKSRLGWRIVEFIKIIIRFFQIFDAFKFDVVFLQRDLLTIKSPFLERLLFLLNKNVIFDFDDALWLFSSKKKIRYIINKAKTVIVGNQNLVNFCRPCIAHIIPTVIDLEKYPLKQFVRDDHPIIIGWTGVKFNYQFFSGYRPVFEKLLKKGYVELNIISESGKIAELKDLPVNYIKWSTQNEIQELIKFDIGIMPLQENELARYKCGLKILQYMAVGIPVVASPIGVNKEIVIHEENGYLADTIDLWIHYLERLINSSDLREKMGFNGRLRVEKYYNVKVIIGRMVELFKERRIAK